MLFILYIASVLTAVLFGDSEPWYTVKKSAVPWGSHQDAAQLHLLQVEGGSTSRMKTVSAAH